MLSETEIRERIEYLESRIDDRSGHDMSHLIGQRNALEWVLNEGESGRTQAPSARSREQRW